MRTLACSLFFLAVIIIASTGTPVFAQATTARLNGVVTDANSAVLPGARVDAQQKGAAVASAITDGQGQFTISNLPPGDYTLVDSYVGFAKFETPVTATAGQLASGTPGLNGASETRAVHPTAERAHREAQSIHE